jgi:hypothetical protein
MGPEAMSQVANGSLGPERFSARHAGYPEAHFADCIMIVDAFLFILAA